MPAAGPGVLSRTPVLSLELATGTFPETDFIGVSPVGRAEVRFGETGGCPPPIVDLVFDEPLRLDPDLVTVGFVLVDVIAGRLTPPIFFSSSALAPTAFPMVDLPGVAVPVTPGLADIRPVVPRAEVAPEAVDAPVVPRRDPATRPVVAYVCLAFLCRSISSFLAASSCYLAVYTPVRPVRRLAAAVVPDVPPPKREEVGPVLSPGVFAGDGCMSLLMLARDDLVDGCLTGVTFSFLASSTAYFMISSPVGPFLTSVRATCRSPSAVLVMPWVANESRTRSSSDGGCVNFAVSSAFCLSFCSYFFCLSCSRRSCQPRFFVSSSAVVAALALKAAGFWMA